MDDKDDATTFPGGRTTTFSGGTPNTGGGTAFRLNVITVARSSEFLFVHVTDEQQTDRDAVS